MSTSNTISKIGAVFYIIWACLHLLAAYSVYVLGRSLDSSMVQGWLFQDAWNLLFFSIIGISLAATLNWRNSAWGYWINFVTVGIADMGFIVFVLVPGYTPAWPSILGPVFWVLAMVFSTIALLTRTKDATRSFTADNTELKHPQQLRFVIGSTQNDRSSVCCQYSRPAIRRVTVSPKLANNLDCTHNSQSLRVDGWQPKSNPET